MNKTAQLAQPTKSDDTRKIQAYLSSEMPTATHEPETETATTKVNPYDPKKIAADRQLMSECIELRTQNDTLRSRISSLLQELYLAQQPADREKMITRLLGDKLSQVRLTGLNLALSRAKLGQSPAGSELTDSARLLLDDDNPEIRSTAATLLAVLRDEKSVEMIISRLTNEKSSSVRAAYIMSLGVLRDRRAAGAIISVMATGNGEDLTEALSAIGRLLDSSGVSNEQIQKISDIILDRYSNKLSDPQQAGMLAIMRRLARPQFASIMESALDDKSAAVRLEAINGLAHMKIDQAAGDIARLIEDPDRGIRQIALETLGQLGATETLPAVLNRTDPKIETDQTVRQRAWKTALELLDNADNTTIEIIADGLKLRTDAGEYRIRILELLSARLAENPKKRAMVDLELSRELIMAGRPAQAAEILAAAYKEVDDKDIQNQLWRTWISSLLAGNDESLVTVISAQNDKELNSQAITMALEHLKSLDQEQDYTAIATLAGRITADLGNKLDNEILDKFSAAASSAQAKQRQMEIAQSKILAEKLTTCSDGEVKALQQQIASLGPIATDAIIEQMATLVENNDNTIDMQKRLLATLTTIAPELTGFDISAAANTKTATLEKWRQSRLPKNGTPAPTENSFDSQKTKESPAE